MDNGTHYSGERHAIGAEVETDPNREVVPVVCDDDGHLIVNISGTTPVVDIGIVQIEDSAGNPLTSVAGSLNVNVTNPASGTQNVNVTQIGGAAITEGQKTSANSVPVVIASDQSAIPVTGTITTSPNVNVHDGTGVSISSTGSSLNTNVTNTVPVTGPLTDTQLRATPVPVSGTVTVVQPTGTNLHTVTDSGSTTVVTGNVTVVQPTGTNLHTVVDSGTITLSGTSPVSGTVTANQGTANTPANKWPIEIVDSAGVNIATVSAAGAVKVDGSAVTQPVSGTVTANIGTTNGLALDATLTGGTQKTQIVDGAGTVVGPEQTISGTNYLPVVLASSGTTGSAVPTRTIQVGGSDGTNLRTIKTSTTGVVSVDGSATTQPVSGTVAVTQSTSPWITQGSGTPTVTILTVGITASSSGDNTLIAAVAAKKIYVFAWNLSFSGTVNAKFTDGAAGTLLSGLYYGIVNAGGGNAVSPPNALWIGSTNTALVLNLSGAVAVGGSVSYFTV